MKYSQLLEYSQNRAKLLNSIKTTKQLLSAVDQADKFLKSASKQVLPTNYLESPKEHPVNVQIVLAQQERECIAPMPAQTSKPVGLSSPYTSKNFDQKLPKQVTSQLTDWNYGFADPRIESKADNSQLKSINTNSTMERAGQADANLFNEATQNLGKRAAELPDARSPETDSNPFKTKLVKTSLFSATGDARSREDGKFASAFSRPPSDHPKLASLPQPDRRVQELPSRSNFCNLTEGEPEGVIIQRTTKLSATDKKTLPGPKTAPVLVVTETPEAPPGKPAPSPTSKSVEAPEKPQMQAVAEADTGRDAVGATEDHGKMNLEVLPKPDQPKLKLEQVSTTPVMILPSGSSRNKSIASDNNRSRVTSVEASTDLKISKALADNTGSRLKVGASIQERHQDGKARSQRSIGSGGVVEVDLTTAIASVPASQNAFTKHEIDKVQRYLNTLAEGLQTVCEKSLTASRKEGIYKKTLHFVQAMFELDDIQLRCLLTNRVGPYLTVIQKLLSGINDTSSPEFCHLSSSLEHLWIYIKNKSRSYVGSCFTLVHHQAVDSRGAGFPSR